TGLAQPWNIADRHIGHVLHQYRHAVRLRKQNILDVADFVSLREVRGTAAVHETDATYIDGLLADIDGAPADIDVGVANGIEHLRKRDAVGVELVQINFDVVLLGGPAPRVHLHDAGNRQQPALKKPVLDRAQIRQPKVRRPDHLISENFADQTRALDRGLHVIW